MATTSAAALQPSSPRTNGHDLDRTPLPNFTSTAHQRQHQFSQHRQLKSSKSVDGLVGRARSHTADPTIHNLRGNFQHIQINSPNLTQTQLDSYRVPSDQPQNSSHEAHPITPLRRGVSVSHNGNEHASTQSRGQGQEQETRTPRRPSQRHQERPQQLHQTTSQERLRQRDQASSPSQSAPSSSKSPYQNLHVQSSQIASRSTPKLSLYPQVSQNNFTNESKETRSFNGLPGQLESKPKSKTSRLKPIVTVEKTNDDHVERDQYGFKKESQWLSHHDFVIFETYYIPIMERRRQKWAIFMNDSHGELPPRSAKLKRYIRKGIPPALRGEAWFHYSGAEDKCNANPGLFKRLVNQAKLKGSSNEYAEVIERDLHRTFPENINFKSQITQQQDGASQVSTDSVAAIQSLRRVLLAFSLHCPSIGYCQSLNYIAGMLLLFMNEEQSFWTLSVIIQNFLPEGMYDVTMEGANVDQAVLMTLIMERLPTVWAKFSGGATSVEMDEGPGLPTVTLVTSHWFLTLFINILPVESILRVWDCFFYEGRKILFRVALTILRMHETEIAKIDDPLEVFQVVQNIPKRMIDCHKLMEACFKRMGSFDLTTKDIDRRYDQFRAKRKSARAAAQASRSTVKK
ncbi:TBC1 domain family member 6 [Entomortierella parvispora]|uniref:TBC1 domain family member 6 n=1 Tax=Entomortierella parvispora TaxID=205924 RepID=A0A9P3HGM7_9FUNG|nr:TBC1 domain family member 6 [Entomortierella parvispora]